MCLLPAITIYMTVFSGHSILRSMKKSGVLIKSHSCSVAEYPPPLHVYVSYIKNRKGRPCRIQLQNILTTCIMRHKLKISRQ